MKKLLKTLLAAIPSIIIGLFYSANALAGIEGDWEGTLNASGQKLPIVIHIKKEEHNWTGTMDSPAQGGFDIPMSKVKVDEIKGKLIFELAEAGVYYEGRYHEQTESLKGNFIQGAAFELNFKRTQDKAVGKNLDNVVGSWQGKLSFSGQSIAFVINIQKENGVFSATHDSPDQGGFGLPVDSVEVEGNQMTVSMSALNSTFKGTLNETFNLVDGKFSQNGISLPLKLAKKN